MTMIRYCEKHKPEPLPDNGKMNIGERLLREAMRAVENEPCNDCRVLSTMIFK